MRVQFIVLIAVSLLFGSAAMAAAPVLSGRYAVSVTNPCQAKIRVFNSTALKPGVIGSIVKSATLGTVGYPGNTTGPAVVSVVTRSIMYPGASDTVVKEIRTLAIGSLEEDVGTLNFNASTKRVTGGLVKLIGSLLNWTGHGGTAFSRTTSTINSPYSTTATTFNLGADTYDAAYANFSGGIARYVTFLKIQDNCIIRGIAIRQ